MVESARETPIFRFSVHSFCGGGGGDRESEVKTFLVNSARIAITDVSNLLVLGDVEFNFEVVGREEPWVVRVFALFGWAAACPGAWRVGLGLFLG